MGPSDGHSECFQCFIIIVRSRPHLNITSVNPSFIFQVVSGFFLITVITVIVIVNIYRVLTVSGTWPILSHLIFTPTPRMVETVIHILQIGRLRLIWMINPSSPAPGHPHCPVTLNCLLVFKGCVEWVVQVRGPLLPGCTSARGQSLAL